MNLLLPPEERSPDLLLKITGDGSHTLYVPSMDEHYHSHYGALTESEHVFVRAGLDFCPGERMRLLEVGFGTGLNSLLTAINAMKTGRHIHYVTIEKYPLPCEVIAKLNYGEMCGTGGKELFNAIHSAAWGTAVAINEYFTIHKMNLDLTVTTPEGQFDLVYFDAFGPDKQPEMWTPEVLARIESVTHEGTVFVTYSAKGIVKRILRSLGFSVTLLPGPPGKRVMTRAVKG